MIYKRFRWLCIDCLRRCGNAEIIKKSGGRVGLFLLESHSFDDAGKTKQIRRTTRTVGIRRRILTVEKVVMKGKRQQQQENAMVIAVEENQKIL